MHIYAIGIGLGYQVIGCGCVNKNGALGMPLHLGMGNKGLELFKMLSIAYINSLNSKLATHPLELAQVGPVELRSVENVPNCPVSILIRRPHNITSVQATH